jgi:voltage-gated potassium channel
MDQPDVEVVKRSRSRPMARLRDADDKYGRVLAAILVTLIVMGAVSQYSVGRLVVPLLFLGIFFLTMLTSGVPRRTIVLLTIVIPVVLAVVGIASVSRLGSVADALSQLVSTALVIACVFFIFRRLSTHQRISRRTVMGSLCVYLFGAMLFSMVYNIIAEISGVPFFVQTDLPSALDYIYFSFITMATVGFGDFTPATDVGKMAVVVEAITGQLYLVVVVALFVSRIGQRRRAGYVGETGDMVDVGDDLPPRD